MGWKFTSHVTEFLKVGSVSEKVSEDGVASALSGCGSGSSSVHKDSSSTADATKRSRVKQPLKAGSASGRSVAELPLTAL